MTFDLDLRNSDEILSNINSISGSTKVFNELSIFLDPTIYMRDAKIWCEFDSKNLPCDYTPQGYVSFRFGYGLTERIYSVTIKGIIIPLVTSSENNSDFLCSVNYYNLDEREQLYVGRGSYPESQYTYTPTSAGNLLFYNHPNGMISNNTPRELARYNFRFTPDYTRGFTSISQTFSAGENLKPTILVHFPNYYNLGSVGSPIGFSLIRTSYDTTTSRPDDTITDSKVISGTAFTRHNYAVIQLEEYPFVIESTNAYFDLSITGLLNPDSEISNPGEISITILSDLNAPKQILYTYLNLNSNNSGEKVGNEFNEFYLSPRFAFVDREDGLALIEFETKELTLRPGRYINYNMTVKGSYANAATTLSLDAGIFQSLETEPIILNTGRTRSGSIRIGTSCRTVFGSYWATFSLSNPESFYKLSSLRINVTPVKNNLEPIFLNTILAQGDMFTFQLPVGGIVNIFAMVNNPPFEDVNILLTTPSGQINDATFKLSVNRQNILAKKTWGNFAYSLTTDIKAQQKINMTINNRCYGLGTLRSSTRTISFNIEGELANLNGINLFSRFRYINPLPNDPTNQISILFRSPIPNTRLSCALICEDADFPSKASIESDLALTVSNSAASFYQQTIFTNSDIKINFSGLQRGSSYKLGCYYSNFGVVQAFIYNTTKSLLSLSDETVFTDLNITEASERQFVKFEFYAQQEIRFTSRLLKLTQDYANRNSNGANIVVSDEDGQTIKGYELDEPTSCDSSTAKNLFPSEMVERNSGKLRLLQEPLITANPISLTEGDVQIAQTYWLVFTQLPTDPVFFNVDELVNSYVENVNSLEELTRFVNTDTIKIKGDFRVSKVVETPLNETEFDLRDFNYTMTNRTINSTTSVFFYADGPRELECDWKLQILQTHLSNSTDMYIPSLSAEEISSCNDGEINCGSLIFRFNNTQLTNLNLTTASLGSYFLDFMCSSEIPLSQNKIVFNHFIMTVEPTIDPEPSNTEKPVDCILFPLDTNCSYSKLYSIAYFAIILLSFLFFDI